MARGADIPLTRDVVRRLSNVTVEELSTTVKIRLEDGSVVPLRDNYMSQVLKLCHNEQGIDLDWLRNDGGDSYYFLSRAGYPLFLEVVRDIPDVPAAPSRSHARSGESHHIVLDQSGSMEPINDSV